MSKDSLAALWKEYEQYLEMDDTDQSWRMLFPCSILSLNQALGDLNGIPNGIMQLIGDEAHGKTTLSFDFLANAQHKGIKDIKLPNGRFINAVFLDFERSYDVEYARICGVDTTKVLNVVTEYAEDSFDIAIALLEQGIQIVIIDSIASIISKSEEGKSSNDAPKMASEAFALSRFMKHANQLRYNADALIIAINQWRANISQMARTDKKPYGARIMKHIPKYNIELARLDRDENVMTIQAFIAKTKSGANGKKVSYKIRQGKGIDYKTHILDLAKDYGILEKSGAWFYYPTKNEYTHRAQGEINAADILPIEEIKIKVIQAMKEWSNGKLQK